MQVGNSAFEALSFHRVFICRISKLMRKSYIFFISESDPLGWHNGSVDRSSCQG